ncbi:MAG: DUF475 domain-containing protein [Patescibacteria group bacterium]|nr:DUF475 domain-containing protein [Patescibacteria group bacterium]
MLRQFAASLILTILATLGVGIVLGPGAAVTTLILIAIEVAFSFDNAVINAKILERMSNVWRRLFLTLGMLIAIVGMRLIFPILIVSVTAKLGWQRVVDLALNKPDQYAHFLEAAHVTISAFGGGFLLVLVLFFFLDHERELVWLDKIERPLQRLGGAIWLAPAIAAVLIGLTAALSKQPGPVLKAGLAGVLLYTIIHAVIETLGRLTGNDKVGTYTGWGAATAFIYLEVLDASFSFDGVLGAFAITNIVPIIAIGLGVGALWVRSLTLYMVKNGTLAAYRYLEHGAHYAILVLVLALLVSIFVNIPDAVTGIAGLGVIGASLIASREANAHRGKA